MIAEVFLDPNILLYACSNAAADSEKQERAAKLIVDSEIEELFEA